MILKEIPERLQSYLKFSYTILLPFQDVEILRFIWSEGITNPDEWKAKIGTTSFSYVDRMHKYRPLHDALGALLPYIGLWESFKFRQLEHVIESHCFEVRDHILLLFTGLLVKKWFIICNKYFLYGLWHLLIRLTRGQ